ncbi:MAG: amino acid permease [Proteobacteria bacterium]|nr:amino acid permease [Pseudomonadota bacterium]
MIKTANPVNNDVPPPGLKRSISLTFLTFYGLGTIIGAGIYVLIGEVVGRAAYLAPLSFLLAAVIAGFTAFTYAELSSRYPRSAGESWYLSRAFSMRWPSLLAGWGVVGIGVISSATIVNGFAGYLHEFVAIDTGFAITLLVVLLGLVAAWGIRESVWLASIITLLEIGGLVFVSVIAIDGIQASGIPTINFDVSISTNTLGPILSGAFLAFYAFIGFEDMVNIAEEVKDPRRNMPRAIMLALTVSTLLYIGIAIIAVLAIDPRQLSQSSAPLAELVRGHSANAVIIISLIGMVAVVNGALIQIIMASRVLYGMAQQGNAPKQLGQVNRTTRTPLHATVLVVILLLVFALWLPLLTLATITSFITLAIFSAMHLTLWRLKVLDVKSDATVNYPLWVPVTGFIISLGFMLTELLIN